MVVDGALLEGVAALVGGDLNRRYAREDLFEGAVAVGQQVPAPADEQIDYLVLPGPGDPL